MDCCATKCGSQLLRINLLQPLTDLATINLRLNTVQELVDAPTVLADIHSLLSQLPVNLDK